MKKFPCTLKRIVVHYSVKVLVKPYNAIVFCTLTDLICHFLKYGFYTFTVVYTVHNYFETKSKLFEYYTHYGVNNTLVC